MSTEGTRDGSSPAPSGGGGCKDPTDAYIALQCFVALDAAVSDHRTKAFDDMKTRMTAVKGIQVTYEDARASQKSALVQLLHDLKSIRKTVECQVTDRRDDLVRCFCKKVKQGSGGSPLAMPSNPCPTANRRDPKDLEELRSAQVAVTAAITAHQRALDDLTGLPAGLKATVEQLAARVKDLNTKICDKSIDSERAFVMQLHYRWEYVQLRRKLTDPSAFVCRIYDLLDELFTLYRWDVCVAGAIAWLEKKRQLEGERTQGQDAETVFIDDVLRCSRPKKPPTPTDDDTDDVDELDPCRHIGGAKPDPDQTEPEKTMPEPYGDGRGEDEPSPTQQYTPTDQPSQTQQPPTTQETQPPSDGPAAEQS